MKRCSYCEGLFVYPEIVTKMGVIYEACPDGCEENGWPIPLEEVAE